MLRLTMTLRRVLGAIGGLLLGALFFIGLSYLFSFKGCTHTAEKQLTVWCPEVMVTIESIVARENHDDETRIPHNEAVKPAFMKLPYVVLANVEGNNIKYEGYILSSPFPNNMTSILDYQRNKIPLCVDLVRMGVFVLYEPLKIQ
ncbi:MAG: hypothetical protein UT32_C0002G0057 [Parcubacteria group bacterium GW2011_GWC2_39_14]|nr:MAG: hypothetical protein UT32_C0002G0057 [Parcubacteria group bacterium GW2011_GWC2_39_14]KKR55282.1 MAG: hypothetical protein UT91_C0003G0057 [Parcubacteria group bacterium GW2011_GWA2_40_23]